MQPGGVIRESTDSRRFENVLLRTPDLASLVDLMRSAMPNESHAGDRSETNARIHVSIRATLGRNSARYSTMEDLEHDTTLPDVVLDLAISVSRWGLAASPTHSLYFSSSPRPYLRATSEDEAWVIGQLQVIGDYLESRVEARTGWITARTFLVRWALRFWILGLVSFGFSRVHSFPTSIQLGTGVVAVLLFVLSVIGSVLGVRRRRPFRLIIRDQQAPAVGESRWAGITGVSTVVGVALTLVLVVLEILSWISRQLTSSPH